MSHIFNALSKLDKYDIALIILTVHCLHLNEKILFIHLFTQNLSMEYLGGAHFCKQ